MPEKFIVICQVWEEFRSGWGHSKDGCSLHLTEKDCQDFIEEYWARMPDDKPDQYSYPEGAPYKVEVDKVTFERINASKNGFRSLDPPPPKAKTTHSPRSGDFAI